MIKYQLPDGQVIKVHGDNILVERIPLPTTSSGGIILSNPDMDATGLGIIRAVGKLRPKGGGEPINIDGLEPGMGCTFLWLNAVNATNRQVQGRIGKNLIFLKWDDILLVWPVDEKHDISGIKSNEAA